MGGTTRIIAAIGTRGFATTVQYDLGNNGANGIYSGTMGSSGCPTLYLHHQQRQWLHLRQPGHRQRLFDRGAYERRQRQPVCQHQRPATSSGALTLASRRATQITFTHRASPSRLTATAAAAMLMAARSAPGLPQTVARTGLIWRALPAARSETAPVARATIHRTGTTRESPWIQTIRTASFSTRSTSGLQRARALPLERYHLRLFV